MTVTDHRLPIALDRPAFMPLLILSGAAGLGFLLVLLTGGEGQWLLFWRDAVDPAQYRMPAWLLLTVRDFTALGGIPVLTLLCLLVGGFLLVMRRTGLCLFLLLTVAGGLGFNQLLKDFFDRARPDLVPHAVEVASASFPSSHAMMSTIIYLTLGLLCSRVLPGPATRRYVTTMAMMMALMIGSTRVILGVHWPTDVLAGWCLGGLWVLLCWSVAAALVKRVGDGR